MLLTISFSMASLGKIPTGYQLVIEDFSKADEKYRKIIKLVVEAGLSDALSMETKIYQGALVEFFTNAKIQDKEQIVSTIKNFTISISSAQLNEYLGFPENCEDKDAEDIYEEDKYSEDIYEEALVSLKYSHEPNKNLKKRYFSDEYKFLADIIGKCVLCKVSSHDFVSQEQFRLMTSVALKKKINWGHAIFKCIKGKLSSGTQGRFLSICIKKIMRKSLSDKEGVTLNGNKKITRNLFIRWGRRIKKGGAAIIIPHPSENAMVPTQSVEITASQIYTIHNDVSAQFDEDAVVRIIEDIHHVHTAVEDPAALNNKEPCIEYLPEPPNVHNSYADRQSDIQHIETVKQCYLDPIQSRQEFSHTQTKSSEKTDTSEVPTESELLLKIENIICKSISQHVTSNMKNEMLNVLQRLDTIFSVLNYLQMDISQIKNFLTPQDDDTKEWEKGVNNGIEQNFDKSQSTFEVGNVDGARMCDQTDAMEAEAIQDKAMEAEGNQDQIMEAEAVVHIHRGSIDGIFDTEYQINEAVEARNEYESTATADISDSNDPATDSPVSEPVETATDISRFYLIKDSESNEEDEETDCGIKFCYNFKILPSTRSNLMSAVPQNNMHGAAPNIEFIKTFIQKEQDELQKVTQEVKHYEENLKFLKSHLNRIDQSIINLQGELEECHSSFVALEVDDTLTIVNTEKQTLDHIRQIDGTAAGIICQVKDQHGSVASTLRCTKDVVGIVASLGKIKDEEINRVLSEYLGLDIMLAIVCKTFEGVQALERYEKDGTIDRNTGIHGIAPTIGRTMKGRFHVFCLQNMRPFVGEFLSDDPHKKLALINPRLPNGKLPNGFLGFAVNMLDLDDMYLSCVTTDGHGLRETLFYNLFSRLQVYRSRADMLIAQPIITDGAVSLDGGIIKGSGLFYLGDRGDAGIRFPVSETKTNMPREVLEIEQQIRFLEWKKEMLSSEVHREESLISKAKSVVKLKSDEYRNLIHEELLNKARSPSPRLVNAGLPTPEARRP